MREQISSSHAAMTLPIRYRARFPGAYVSVRVARLCVLLVLSGGDAGVCLSTCCAYSPRACLSLSTWGPQVSGKITPMLGSDPKDAIAPLDSLLYLVVGRRKLSTRRWWSEHNAPAGGFSTSIVQSSGRTGRRDLAPHPHEKPSRARIVLTCLSLNFRGPTENKPNGEHFPGVSVTVQPDEKCSLLALVLVIRLNIPVNLHFQVPSRCEDGGFMRN